MATRGGLQQEQQTRYSGLYLQSVHDGNMMICGTDPEIGRRLARVMLSGSLNCP